MSRAIDLPSCANAPVPAAMWGRCRAALARVIRNAVEEQTVRGIMKALHALDDRTLKDIGVTRSEIESYSRWGRKSRPYH
jgi:uncharacterized protein YjiS (DUF1127 family)